MVQVVEKKKNPPPAGPQRTI